MGLAAASGGVAVSAAAAGFLTGVFVAPGPGA